MTTRRIIDLSHAVDESTPPFPGDPPVRITIFASPETAPPGSPGINGSGISMSLHCGTHMDAPFHFVSDRATIDRVPLERCLGPTEIVRVHGVSEVRREHLEPHAGRIREVGRVILETGWWRRWKTDVYFAEFPVIAPDAARFLVDAGVRLVGVDFPSVDRPPHETHLVLLGNDVLILENLTNLDALPDAPFELITLPLRVAGRDGSPVRAIALVE